MLVKITNNDNEPPSLMQFWSHADEKLVINKSWPNKVEYCTVNLTFAITGGVSYIVFPPIYKMVCID